MKPTGAIELRVTPDRYVTIRYAGASGDFNPIHLDDEFAREVGLPGRILHGLWTMAQVARAATAAAGGRPEQLRSLSVEFRGAGMIGEEIVVSGTLADRDDGLIANLVAVQGGKRIVRNGVARLRPRLGRQS